MRARYGDSKGIMQWRQRILQGGKVEEKDDRKEGRKEGRREGRREGRVKCSGGMFGLTRGKRRPTAGSVESESNGTSLITTSATIVAIPPNDVEV